jgi:hypothetical protein
MTVGRRRSDCTIGGSLATCLDKRLALVRALLRRHVLGVLLSPLGAKASAEGKKGNRGQYR